MNIVIAKFVFLLCLVAEYSLEEKQKTILHGNMMGIFIFGVATLINIVLSFSSMKFRLKVTIFGQRSIQNYNQMLYFYLC